MQSPEALHLQSVLRLSRETELIGVRAERVLKAAARSQARLLGSSGPVTQQALQARIATIQQVLEQAGVESYLQFVDDLSDYLARWTPRDAKEVQAAVQSAIDQGIQLQTTGTAGDAAGISVQPSIGQQVQISQQALRAVARMGPLELTLAGSKKAPYSLSREFAKAFISPDQRSLRQNWAIQVNRLQDVFETEIRGAVISGTTNQDIVRNLLGSGDQIGRLQAPLTQVKTLARTGALSTANAVNVDQLQQNTAVEYVRLLATLDQRTSPICRNLDGTIYRKDDAPQPPLHWGCRSTLVAHIPGRESGSRSMTMAVVDENGQLLKDKDGKALFVGAYDSRYADRFTAEQKRLIASNADGSPPKYADWLKAQPAAAQDSILGQRNGQTYRNTGSLTRATTKSSKRAINSFPTPLKAKQIRRRPKSKPVASPVTAAPPARPAPPPSKQ